MKHAMVTPPSLREKVPTISPDIEQVVMTALAKDPKQRFGSVQAFANALEQASRSVQPEPPAPMTAETSQSQRPTVMASSVMQLSEQVTVGDTPADTSAQTHEIAHEPNEVVSAPVIVPRPNPSPQQDSIPVRESQQGSPRRGVSRRTVVVGLGVAGLVVVGGSIVGLALFYGQHPSPIPLGTRLYTYRGHSNVVDAVAWSPDGTRIASGSGDHTVQVWDAANGGYVFTYRGHSLDVLTVAWSPDGTRIASGSGDHTVQVWGAG